MIGNQINELFTRTDRELWLVTVQAGRRSGGCIATFVSQASIVPDMPRVVLGLARQHFTWELIEEAGAFALHLFTEEHLDWVWRFGTQSGRQHDKLAEMKATPGATGSPLLADALGWLECRVEDRLDTGDRTIYLAQVLHGQIQPAGQPLTAQRMIQLAPREKLAEMHEQLNQDISRDAAGIQSWRERVAGRGKS